MLTGILPPTPRLLNLQKPYLGGAPADQQGGGVPQGSSMHPGAKTYTHTHGMAQAKVAQAGGTLA